MLYFILIIGMQLFAVPIESKDCDKPDFIIHPESGTTSEIKNADNQFYIAILISNCSQIITEVHRLLSVLILSNQIVPIGYDFKSTILTSIIINFSSPVPIFIKGHALLN